MVTYKMPGTVFCDAIVVAFSKFCCADRDPFIYRFVYLGAEYSMYSKTLKIAMFNFINLV